MGDARHKGSYREGNKLQGTKTWAERVDAKLAENEKANVSPRNRAELARAVSWDKSGLKVFLEKLKAGKTASSVYVEPICAALEIDLPLIETPSISEDELARVVARISDVNQRAALLVIVKGIVGKKK